MATQASRVRSHPEWLSIHEAAVLIGVSPATLRRWSDAGDIRSFTTPGGHRRFSRAAVVRLLPSDPPARSTLDHLGETPQRMARVYRHGLRNTIALIPWLGRVGEDDRLQLREHGRRIAAALLESFDAPTAESRQRSMAKAEESAAVCGRIACRHGVALSDTVEAVLHFRMPFMQELAAVARRRGLGTPETTRLLEMATEAVDRLLSAAMQGHAGACAGGARP
jgi:excisionase family DNA binding protein